MNLDLEPLADEAIEQRSTAITQALLRHHVAPDHIATGVDHLDQARTLLAGTWERLRPELAQLANQRLAGVARLAAEGILAGPGCSASADGVVLEAVRDAHPVGHRYILMRGLLRAGVAWLSFATPPDTPYVVRLSDGHTVQSHDLHHGLVLAARHLADQAPAEAGAR